MGSSYCLEIFWFCSVKSPLKESPDLEFYWQNKYQFYTSVSKYRRGVFPTYHVKLSWSLANLIIVWKIIIDQFSIEAKILNNIEKLNMEIYKTATQLWPSGI